MDKVENYCLYPSQCGVGTDCSACMGPELSRRAALIDSQAAEIERLKSLVPRPGEETGWLVEDAHTSGVIRYRTMGQSGPEWTTDVNMALRFSRRKDAELFSFEDEDAWRIVEHMWMPPLPPPATGEQQVSAQIKRYEPPYSDDGDARIECEMLICADGDYLKVSDLAADVAHLEAAVNCLTAECNICKPLGDDVEDVEQAITFLNALIGALKQ